MLAFSLIVILTLIVIYLSYLIIFPKKDDKKKDKSLKYLENKKHGKVDLNQNIGNKDNNNKEKTIDRNNKIENKKSIEISLRSMNDRLQEGKIIMELFKKKENKIMEDMKIIEEEQKKLKEELQLTDLNMIIQEQKIKILENKNNMSLNAYKILYFRKIANILLEKIFENYSDEFFKTESIFKQGDKEKPGYKANYFPIIIAKEKIGNFSINMINLLIDYLMYIKDFTSSFNHIVKNFPIQLEILFSKFGDSNIKKDENNNYIIETSFLINTLLGDDNIQEKKNDKKENIEDIKAKKEENMEEVLKENKIRNNIIKDIKDKDKDIEEKKKGNLKGRTIKKKNNNRININEGQMAKNNLMAKIDNIINSLKFNEQNFSENDIINKIKELNLEKLLTKENEFTKNELSKIKHIKELRDIINKNKDSLREGNIIDIYYIFLEWKNSFNKSYKAEENFKKLVIYDEKIELSDIKKVASYLINVPNKEKIEISSDVPEYFKNIKFNILKESQFDSYFNQYEKK